VSARQADFWDELRKSIKEKAVEVGLGPTAVAVPRSTRVAEYQRWIDRGMHGEMSYMSRDDRVQRRQDLSLILPNVKAVVVSSLMYWPGRSGFLARRGNSVPQGEVSCYAWGRDYHHVLDDRLGQLAKWMHERAGGVGRWYVDTGAILERDLGQQAGLGFVGKNTMLINPRYGSGFFLGEILTTLPLPPDSPAKMPGCGKCQRCKVACPTNAFSDDFVLDARKCISYLTIELKGIIPEELRSKMGTKVYGCDICQQVCPWNKFDWAGEEKAQSPLFGKVGEDVQLPDLVELLTMTEATFNERFKGTAIFRIGCERMRRNAAVALGNSTNVHALKPLEDACRDGSELVRIHAQWALKHLRSQLS